MVIGEAKKNIKDSIRNWIRKALGIQEMDLDLDVLRCRLKASNARIDALEATIREHTTMGVDIPVSKRDACSVIMVGRYKSQDYVRVFEIRADDFGALVRQLGEHERQAGRYVIDAPYGLRAAYLREKCW